jgi:hypothetical protein
VFSEWQAGNTGSENRNKSNVLIKMKKWPVDFYSHWKVA